MMPIVLLTATTDAEASSLFRVVNEGGKPGVPAHFTCPGIAGAETGTMQMQDASEGWHDYYVDGTLQQVTATNTGVAVYAPGIYRINKSSTAGATSVEVSTEGHP